MNKIIILWLVSIVLLIKSISPLQADLYEHSKLFSVPNGFVYSQMLDDFIEKNKDNIKRLEKIQGKLPNVTEKYEGKTDLKSTLLLAMVEYLQIKIDIELFGEYATLDWENGKTRAKGYMHKDEGYWMGEIELYHGNGVLNMKTMFTNGSIQGKVKIFDVNGELSTIEIYDKGKIKEQIEYVKVSLGSAGDVLVKNYRLEFNEDEISTLRETFSRTYGEEYVITKDEFYDIEQQLGKRTSYRRYFSGSLESFSSDSQILEERIVSYKGSEKHGSETIFSYDQNLNQYIGSINNYVDGRLEGDSLIYYPLSEKIREKKTYDMGLQTYWAYYHENGVISLRYWFDENGEKTKSTAYSDTGSPISTVEYTPEGTKTEYH